MNAQTLIDIAIELEAMCRTDDASNAVHAKAAVALRDAAANMDWRPMEAYLLGRLDAEKTERMRLKARCEELEAEKRREGRDCDQSPHGSMSVRRAMEQWHMEQYK